MSERRPDIYSIKLIPFDVRAFREDVLLWEVGDFAALFGVSMTQVEEWESGKGRPPKTLRILARLIEKAPLDVRNIVLALAESASPREFEMQFTEVVTLSSVEMVPFNEVLNYRFVCPNSPERARLVRRLHGIGL